MTHRGCLIGCGFFARNHMNAWSDLPGAGITAVCDTDRTRAEAFARDFGVANVYTDAAAMLTAERPDFCDIATTPPSHRALVELAARHARVVICQKPIADTLEDARAMVAACDASGAALVIHENFRWQAPLMRMKSLIDNGAIGTVRQGRFEFRHKWDVYAGQPYLAEFPRLAIMDVGVHVFDVARHFMGEAAAVTCETQRRNTRVRGEDAFVALTRHADGGIAVCDVSFHSRHHPEPFPQVWARVEGDAGTVELLDGYRLVLHGEEGRTDKDAEPAVPAWAERPWHVVQDSVRNFQAHVVQVLDGRAAPQPSGADNLRTLELCLAAYESAETGRRVSLGSAP